MQHTKVYTKGKARIFNSPVLEFFTKTHPLIIWGMYIPILFFLLRYAYLDLGYSGWHMAIVGVVGMFSWTLFEYLAHRYVFHLVSENPKTKRLVYVLHGNHHEYPHDRQRLFMPPLPSILLASSIFGIMYLVMRGEAFVFFPGFVFGYLLYGTMHYLIHSGPPPVPWMRRLWRNHHLHHYKDDDQGFGVSSTLWDHVFHTNFNLNQPRTVSTVRSRTSQDRDPVKDQQQVNIPGRKSTLRER